MDDLVKWLGEQLDEDRRVAEAAPPGPWIGTDVEDVGAWSVYDPEWLIASATVYTHDEPMGGKRGLGTSTLRRLQRTSPPTTRRGCCARSTPSDRCLLSTGLCNGDRPGAAEALSRTARSATTSRRSTVPDAASARPALLGPARLPRTVATVKPLSTQDDRLAPGRICTCMHAETRHTAGPCTGQDSYGLPCECPSFELDRMWSGLTGDE